MQKKTQETKIIVHHLSVKGFIGGFFSGIGQLIFEVSDT